MTIKRWSARRDRNEPDIVAALVAAGARVWRLDRPVDLLVAYGGRWIVLEVKDSTGKPTDEQAEFIGWCQAAGYPAYVVRTPEDALQAIGAIR